MALWGTLRQELDRAGRAAQQALDEGWIRLDLHRARQRTDRGAQALGWALYRARQEGGDIDPEQYARLSSEIAAAEAEVARHEDRLRELRSNVPAAPSAPLGEPTHASG
jgi:hypothetical protein